MSRKKTTSGEENSVGKGGVLRARPARLGRLSKEPGGIAWALPQWVSRPSAVGCRNLYSAS